MERYIAIVCFLLLIEVCKADTTGPNYSGTGGVSGAGTAWSNTANAVGSTADNYASVSLSGNGETSEYLELTNFGFSIPDGQDIDGITVEIRYRQSGTKIEDNTVQLIVGGIISGNNNGADNALPGSATIGSYGGTTDTWGLSLTEAGVEASNFGVAIRFDKQGGGGAETGEIDWVRVTVTSSTSSSASGADSDREVTAGGTDNSWSPLTNQVATSNNSYEQVTLSKGDNSQYLILDNFGLSVPGTHQIDGIEVTIERNSSGNRTSDYLIYLVDETGIIRTSGTNQADLGTDWPTTDGSATYGSSSDLWGEAAGFWTPAKLNDADFGVAIAVLYENSGPAGSRTASIDFVSISITSSSPPLPVELLEFKGEMYDDGILLEWVTAAEINNDHFKVEHSIDGINFEVIGIVEGNGNSVERHFYSQIHHFPSSGNNYFRLKQVDFDGQYNYSKVIAIRVNVETISFNSIVIPNPISGNFFTIRARLYSDSEPFGILIFDINGRIVSERNYQPLQKQVEIEYDLELQDGIHFIHLYQGEFGHTDKLVVIR